MKQQFEFKILHGIFEDQHKPIKVIVCDASLIKAIKRIGDFYFRCTIVECHKVNGKVKLKIPEISNIKTHDLKGNRYDLISQLINNQKALKR